MSGESPSSTVDSSSGSSPTGFEALIREEHARIAASRVPDAQTPGEVDARPKQLEVAPLGVTNEPWVAFTTQDYFGLALSGGGIRSATFNLGLLQALADKGVLKHTDYLSTVSGGGYIGAFWTAWRHRHQASADVFPSEAYKDEEVTVAEQKAAEQKTRAVRDERESARIRHLRQFSRFLMPRVGIAHSETWAGVVAILGGMLPSLSTAVALLGVALYGWFALSVIVLAGNYHRSLWIAPLVFGAITLALHAYMESRWRKANTAGDEKTPVGYAFLCIFTVLASALMVMWLRKIWTSNGDEWKYLVKIWAPPVGVTGSCNFVGEANCRHVRGVVFGASAAWGGVALALLILRSLIVGMLDPTNCVKWSSIFDRTIARLLAPAVVCLGLALTWMAGAWVREFDGEVMVASSGIGLTALFATFRNWLAKPIVRTQGSELWTKFLPWLRPLLPQILANAAFVCFLVVVAILIQTYGLAEGTWLVGSFGALGALLMTLSLFDPARVGMHDFYRSRIARCFLGAARPVLPRPSQLATTEQPLDDLTFAELSQGHARPIHLVCCAANNLSGDPLGGLYRGARSAVVSPAGISIADAWAPMDKLHDLRLSSAITASAAAFNSQMGSISMELGPAVAFLMSALNLRLGLWVPHPLSKSKARSQWFPGWPFFLEMLGLTSCGPETAATKLGLLGSRVHLSDGAHFENLALYELVRRHCRYIIVSDCGADPDYAFADLANAVRRVREDFGVEVELDTNPLRPSSNGRATQHAVVGTIHYDGVTGTDKGRLIYFKPVLTGDEPPDILQYQTRRSRFPQETTADQFYDEAQWESYRRLGEHAVNAALRKISRVGRNPVDGLFLDASQLWQPRPDGHGAISLELSQRYLSLEAAIRQEAPPALRAEFFPEVAEALRGAGPRRPSTEQRAIEAQPAHAASTEDENTRILYFVASALQLMEDVWVALELEIYWSHPLNEGWMNYFQRWASAPSLRRWWPVLRPLYNVGFRDFVRDRFELRLNEPLRNEMGRGAQLKLVPVSPPSDEALDGLAWQQWLLRYPAPNRDDKCAFVYELELEGSNVDGLSKIQVGFLLYCCNESLAQWHEADLFVPQSLNGSGITARFLDAVISYFARSIPEISELRVTFGTEATPDGAAVVDVTQKPFSPLAVKSASKPFTALGRGAASRRDQVHRISFYKSRGFTYLGADARNVMTLDLAHVRKESKAKG